MLKMINDRIAFNLGCAGWFVFSVKAISQVVAWVTGESSVTFV